MTVMRLTRRGLTLVEVLCASVLLAVLASACVPMLTSSLRRLHEPVRSFQIEELAEVADLAMSEPNLFGVDRIDDLSGQEIAWPNEASDRPAIRVELLELAAAEQPNHAWLVFSCAEQAVYRWMKVESDAEEEPNQ